MSPPIMQHPKDRAVVDIGAVVADDRRLPALGHHWVHSRPWAVAGLILVMSVSIGCSSFGSRRPLDLGPAPQVSTSPPSRPLIVEPTPLTAPEATQSTAFEQLATAPRVGEPVDTPAQRRSGNIFLNFYDADIREITQYVLGDQLKRNYVIDPGVVGKVTVQMNIGLTAAGLLDLYESLLAINNAALVEDPSGLFRIVTMDKVSERATVPLVYHRGQSLPPGYQTRVVPLQFVGANELRAILKPFLSERISLLSDPQRNLFIIGGAAPEVAKLLDTIALFDVDWMAGMSFGLYPLTFADPPSMIRELQSVFGRTTPNAELPADGSAATGLPTGDVIRFIGIERLNAVLAISAQPAYITRAKEWIARLDQGAGTDDSQIFVYRLQNSKAEDVANLLSAAFGAAGGQADISDAGQVAPGLDPVTLKSPGARTTSLASNHQGQAVTLSVGQGGPTRVVADTVNNSLVVTSTARQYQILLPALRNLDIAPMQVLIEASIIEVTLTDDLQYGVEWFFKNNFNAKGEKTGQGRLDLGGAGLAAISPGFSYAIVNDAKDVRAVLNALASESKVKVLSSPSIMVLGNQTATINVGDQVPVPTRQSVSNIDPGAPTVNEITYRDTGVILDVTPRVNSGGLVTMEVSQEVSDVGRTTSSGIDAPTFQQRKIASTVAVQSGNTVVLGGMIRDRRSDNESGIPGLYRLPVVGKLFGTTGQESRRTELLVVITPRAVADAEQADAVTREFQSKLDDLKPRP